MTIGEVLTVLRSDFPETSISKIRFLEGEGLVTPQRAPSGYRRFTPEDVERLRLVLLAQRDHYLPLRVIKERLEAGELEATLFPESEPEEDPHPQRQHEIEVVSPEPAPAAPGRSPDIDPQQSFTLRELAEEAGLPLDTVKAMESIGVLEADAAGRYSGSQVLVCRAYAVLRTHGVNERHLRQVKNAASRDASLIDQSVVHLQAGDRTTSVAEMLEAFSDAHYWLVRAELNRSAPSGSHRPRSPLR